MAIQNDLSVTLESNAFPCDRLQIRRLTGTEAIGRLFDFELEVVSLDHDGPPAAAMVGARVTLVLEGARRLHGMIAGVEDRLATTRDLRVYRLRFVPRAFVLTMIETQDIFMGLSVPELVEAKLKAAGLGPSFLPRLLATYPKREFVVQYKESDHAFLCRLVEHLGVSFYFRDDGDDTRMIFTDDNAGFTQAEGAASIPYRSRGEARDVFDLTVQHGLVPSYFAVRDFNYRTPLVDITGEAANESGFAGGVIEVGSHHKTLAEGQALAKVRVEERRAGEMVYTARSTVAALGAGTRFTLGDHPDLGDVALLVTEVRHDATLVGSGQGAGGEAGYTNTFHAIPADRTYRPPRTTPRPHISGLVTGIVDPGPAGPDARGVQLDDQGRYQVRFLFDTTPVGERAASRPVRMLQSHVGENYGTHFPLKPGVEVAIAFIDGDPDRPLIVGAVPNPIKPSPVTNANPNVHRIRTSTGITVDIGE